MFDRSRRKSSVISEDSPSLGDLDDQVGDRCVGRHERLGLLEVLVGEVVRLELDVGERTPVERLGLLLRSERGELEGEGRELDGERSENRTKGRAR